MIGFKLKATGSNAYRYSAGGWTEGSLIGIQILLKLTSPVAQAKSPMLSTGQNKALKGIEASFKRMAQSMFDRVCGQGFAFTLFVSGDFDFKYYFDPDKSPEQIRSELMHVLASQTDDIGDQVMIRFCEAINGFILHNFDSNDEMILKIQLDL